MINRELVLQRKREISRQLRANPQYRQKEADYSKQYRQCPDVKKQKVTNQIRYERLKKFGITEDDYNEMLEAQGFSCAICEGHISSFKRSLAVDHCHTSGAVRGLLCTNCNLGLGNFKDNPNFLLSAISYLNRMEKNT